MTVTRRRFVLSTAAVPLSGVCRGANGIIGASVVRPPRVGQSWVYAKHDLFTRKKITEETNYISASGARVDIQVHADPAAERDAVKPSWDADWWRKRLGNYAGAPPSEVHEPWGIIWIDPHWEELQVMRIGFLYGRGNCVPAGRSPSTPRMRPRKIQMSLCHGN
jgi:hypothetical protein